LSALAGMCELTGVADGPPMLLYGPYIDYIASLLGTSAALAGVMRSRKTGRGAFIDLSQYECGLVFMGAALKDFFASGRVPARCGHDAPLAVPHGAFPCRDQEWVALSCWSDADFAALAQAIGDETLAADARFTGAAARRANIAALEEVISAWTAQRSAEAAAVALQAAGVGAYPVVTWPASTRIRSFAPAASSACGAMRGWGITLTAIRVSISPRRPATSWDRRPASAPTTTSCSAISSD